MKILSILSFMFLIHFSYAQKFYAGADGALMIPIIPQHPHGNYTPYAFPTTSTNSANSLTGSYTSGFSVGGFLGYQLNENISFEAGMHYLSGNEYSSKDTYTDLNQNDKFEYKTKLAQINFYPAIKFSLPYKPCKLYMRTGFLFGITSITEEENETRIGSQNLTTEYANINTGYSWGFFHSIGIEKNLKHHLKIFAEWTLRYQAYLSDKGNVTKDVYNGVDQLGFLNSSQRNFVYVDSYAKVNSSDPNQPSKILGYKQAFDSMGLQVGIIYVFGKANTSVMTRDTK